MQPITHKSSRRLVGLAWLSACAVPTTPGAPAWQAIDTAGIRGRWGQTAQYDARRDRMLVFGGQNDTGQLADLLVLQLDTLAWQSTDMSPTIYGRTDLASALDTLNDRLILIGGRIGLATSIPDVEAFDLETETWTALPQGPTPRHDITAASDGAHAWVFGGAGEFLQSLGDLWQLDFATDTWTQLPEPGDAPSARTSYALAYRAGALYLIGGHDTESVQRDAWRYDLAAQRWTELAIVSSPPAWAHFGDALDACGRVILEGGDNLDSEDTSLGTTFTLDSATFAGLATSNLPPARDHPSMVFDSGRGQLVLYGGGTLGDGLGTLSDAWSFPLGP
ncbi:MAG TPA: kelch repeat-containing protein, partial [Kofleriaceae bacterium]|nr:kelch repeat-containing protein [Kofleriaceae bacterium]